MEPLMKTKKKHLDLLLAFWKPIHNPYVRMYLYCKLVSLQEMVNCYNLKSYHAHNDEIIKSKGMNSAICHQTAQF